MKTTHLLVILCIAGLFSAFPAFAQTTADTGFIALDAEEMSKGLLCELASVLRGDLGLILGLCIGFFGFYLLIVQEFKIQGFLFILFGVFITAIPDFFITTINSIMSMSTEIFSGEGIAIPC